MITSNTLFARVFELLYPGDDGMLKFTLAMDVNYRTVERWRSNKMFPPPAVWRELLARVRDLGQHCDEVEREINRLLAP